MQVLSKIVILFSIMVGGLFVVAPETAFASKCELVVGEEGKWYKEGTDGKKLK